MPTSPAFVCSMCRKPIPVGAKVIKCSVSTCNSGRAISSVKYAVARRE